MRTLAEATNRVTVELTWYRGSAVEELRAEIPELDVAAWVTVARGLSGWLRVAP